MLNFICDEEGATAIEYIFLAFWLFSAAFGVAVILFALYCLGVASGVF